MPDPKCPSCGLQPVQFEYALASPPPIGPEILLVQCAECGAVVGITQTFDMRLQLGRLGATIQEMKEQLNALSSPK